MVEGAKLLGEAVTAGALVETVFVDAHRAKAGELAVVEDARRSGADVLELQPGVLERVCDAVHGPAVAAVVEMVDVPLPEVDVKRDGPVLVGVGIRDPGNAGTIIRSAGASGAVAVIFCSGSVDMYNPKTVRSSAGALFQVPVVAGESAEEVLAELGRRDVHRIAATPVGGRDYTSVDLTSPVALVLGGEANGLSPGLLDRVDGRITIPMVRGTESLNVAMAATVLCFEAARQREARSR